MSEPWNDWYHCNGNTYGTWLRGDPRGFRERRHRRHVEGDYRNPPPDGKYEALHRRSVRLLKGDAVHLDSRQCRVALGAMVRCLVDRRIEVIAVSVDGHHFHVLGRFPDGRPRHWVGRAKRRASVVLREFGLPGRVWALKSRALPVRDRDHQVNTFHYIERHRERGAAVWTCREPVPGTAPDEGTQQRKPLLPVPKPQESFLGRCSS